MEASSSSGRVGIDSALSLHHTLSGLDKRLEAMVALLEEGTTSTTKSSMNAPELIRKLEEFGASYCSLPGRCDHLKWSAFPHESRSTSRGTPEDQMLAAASSSYQPDNGATDDEIMENLVSQSMLSQGIDDKETNWLELKFRVAKLMEENLWHQAELARRNVEKKVAIRRLQSEVQHLRRQNLALQDSISFFETRGRNHRSFTSKLHQLWDKLVSRDQ